MENAIISFEDIQNANNTIVTTDIKGKEYAEVNQRIKAFRMVYPNGAIETEMLSNENGVCIFKALVGYRDKLSGTFYTLGTGTAYEKENSTFINKTSYIENCETSAVGRALGMAGFGIDTSVASAEEVRNAMANQVTVKTKEEALKYEITFGKHEGKTLGQLFEEGDKGYINWLFNNAKDETLKQCISLIDGREILTEEEQNEAFDLMEKMGWLVATAETNYDELLKRFGVQSNREMSIPQLREAVAILEKKVK